MWRIEEKEKPFLIIGKTTMGRGALDAEGNSFERKVSTHGQPLSKAGASVSKTIENLGGDPDNPFVVFPEVEAYYQETGRAGRDGEPADAWMAYGLQDVIKLRQMMASSAGSEAFKRAEQHRLNAMLGLCEITTCRRQSLLAYFGDTLEQPCGNCDTCLQPVATWDGTEAARKVPEVIEIQTFLGRVDVRLQVLA